MTNTDTCDPKCPHWRKWKEKCPHYMYTGWRAAEGGQPVYLNDCAPKRSVLMQMELHAKIDGYHESVSSERKKHNETIKLLLAHIGQLTDNVPQIEVENVELLQIEEKDEDNHK